MLFDDVPYICTIDHTSSPSFATDTSKWDLLYSNLREYANNTFYKLGSIVKRGGQVYECIKEHTSSSTGFGVTDWRNLSGYANWQQNFIYASNDIVNYENDLYCCKVAHTSDTTFSEDNWEPMTALATKQDIKDMWL